MFLQFLQLMAITSNIIKYDTGNSRPFLSDTNELDVHKKGYDQRNITSLSDKIETLEYINKNFRRQLLLNKLQSNDSLLNKLNLLKSKEYDYLFDDIPSVNITAGGLFNDWNFEI